MAPFGTFQNPTSWFLVLALGLALLQQAAVALVRSAGTSDLKKTSVQQDITFTTEDIQEAPLPAQFIGQIEEGEDKGVSKDLFLPLQPVSSVEGSVLEKNVEGNGEREPSSGVSEMFVTDGEEKRDLEEGATELPPPPAVTGRLLKGIIYIDDAGRIMIMKRSTADFLQTTTTLPARSGAAARATSRMNAHHENTTPSLLTVTTTVGREVINATPVRVFSQIPSDDGMVDHKGTNFEDTTRFERNMLKSSSVTIPKALTNKSSLEPRSITNQSFFTTSVLPSEPRNVGDEREAAKVLPLDPDMAPKGNGTDERTASSGQTPPVWSSSNDRGVIGSDGHRDDAKRRWFGGVFGPKTDASGPCVFGLGHCVVSPNSNGTLLQWEDLQRTLAFAWELHVFGCAILFLLVMGLAVWGVVSGVGMPHPFSEALIFTNALLLLEGLLRFAQFVVDPYGTRRVLARPVLTALYNLPVPLLLWAQATLALLALRGERMNLLPSALQRSHVTRALAALHVVSLMMADLLSYTLSPALPLMLQMLSICWGLPLCLGILFRALTPQRSTLRTPVPQRGSSKWSEEGARRILMACALLGVLCCALQIHSLLWLYGLLGDWRRFGWGWWLGQFWARLLELAWSFSLLLLGSRMYWRPRGPHRRGEQGQVTPGRKKRETSSSCWNRVLKSLPAGPWRKQENAWVDLLPNNWAAYQRSSANNTNLALRNYEPPTSTTKKDGNTDDIGLRAYNNDPHASFRRSHVLERQERDCILSLIEFDLCPPSPIELRRSIDNALIYSQLLGSMGSLFTPPPPSWTQSGSSTAPPGGDFALDATPTHIAYRWALEAGSSPISPQRFRTAEHCEVSVIDPKALLPETPSERKPWERDSVIPAVNEDGDWGSIASGDDITNL